MRRNEGRRSLVAALRMMCCVWGGGVNQQAVSCLFGRGLRRARLPQHERAHIHSYIHTDAEDSGSILTAVDICAAARSR